MASMVNVGSIHLNPIDCRWNNLYNRGYHIPEHVSLHVIRKYIMTGFSSIMELGSPSIRLNLRLPDTDTQSNIRIGISVAADADPRAILDSMVDMRRQVLMGNSKRVIYFNGHRAIKKFTRKWFNWVFACAKRDIQYHIKRIEKRFKSVEINRELRLYENNLIEYNEYFHGL